MRKFINGFWLSAAVVLLASCEPLPTGQAGQSAGGGVNDAELMALVARMEPVAEAECRRRAPDLNCDLQILVDQRRNQPPNAFQTEDRNGTPLIVFTRALINDADNVDELAFVLGHEAAHHIARHRLRQGATAQTGAILGGLTALSLGGDLEMGARVGGLIGSRIFSKSDELEADALGTVIARKAGYDPVRGAEFFNRIPDPGDRFLGTHPPNAARIETVRRVNAGL